MASGRMCKTSKNIVQTATSETIYTLQKSLVCAIIISKEVVIVCVVRYPSCVVKKGIKINQNTNANCRYSLEIPIIPQGKKDNGTVCVILKNPSKANLTQCDITVCRVCNAASYNDYSKVIVLNLFPYYSTESVGLKSFFSSGNYADEMNKNETEIQKFCTKSVDTVFAWGQLKFSKSLYDSVIQNTIPLVNGKTFYVKCIKCNKNVCSKSIHGNIRYPLHGQCWSNTSPFIPY